MSYRYFLHLLNGLSVRSRFALAISDKRSNKGARFETNADAAAFAASGYGYGTGA